MRGVVDNQPLTDERGAYWPEQFTYQITFAGITGANPVGNGTIVIQADAEFAIQETTYYFIDTANPTYARNAALVPDIAVLITDTGSGRQFMNQNVPVESMFGTAQLPFVWPRPKILAASSTLQVQFVSTANFGGNTYRLVLSFIGEKRYRKGV